MTLVIARPGQSPGGNEWGRQQSIARFWSHVDKSAGPDGCWPWKGETRLGYGRFRSPYFRDHESHRIAYVLMVGRIPAGLEIDHRCHTADSGCPGGNGCTHRRCSNPGHMEPVTHAENLRRAVERRLTCRNGHDRAEEWTNGRCGACNRDNQARWRERQRLLATAYKTHSVALASQRSLTAAAVAS